MVNDVRKAAKKLRKLEEKNLRRARSKQYRLFGKERIFAFSSLILGVAGITLMFFENFTTQIIGTIVATVGLIFGVTSFKWGVTPRTVPGTGVLTNFGVLVFFVLGFFVFGWIRNPFTIQEWDMRRQTVVRGVVQQIQNYQSNNKGLIPDEGSRERFVADYLKKIPDFFDPEKQMPYLVTIDHGTPDKIAWINIIAGTNCNFQTGAAMFCVEIMMDNGTLYRQGNGKTDSEFGN